MKDIGLAMLLLIVSMVGLITFTYNNLEYAIL